jgi:Lon protease-like protein
MASQSETGFLRLFPLQSVVLFPGMPLPLTVFEPRYLELMNQCTAAQEPFGVLLLKEGPEVGPNSIAPFEIGTTAHIQKVYSGGSPRVSVTSVGGERFRVRSFNYDYPYLAAEVQYLDDNTASLVDSSLIDHVKDGAITFVRAVLTQRGEFLRDVELPDEPTELSFRVAQLFQGNPSVQQKLLESDTFDRLSDERDLIKAAMNQLIREGERQHPRTPPSFSAN